MYGRSRSCWSGRLGRVIRQAEANVDWFEGGHRGVRQMGTEGRGLALYDEVLR